MDDSREQRLLEMERHFETVACNLGPRFGWDGKTWADWMKHAKHASDMENER